MKVVKHSKQQDHPLDLIQFLKGLYDAGRIQKDDLQKLVKVRKPPKEHVLVFIANQEIADLKNPGKILDLETLTQILAEMAIQAALTGHLVFSTLHINDAPSAITRLLELDVPSYLIKATVIGIMAQRLMRVLCPLCKKAEPLDKELWAHLDPAWLEDIPEQVYSAEGCRECRDTGFQGREGIYEVMPLSEELQAFAEDKADLPKLRQQAYKEGMSSLRHSGAMKVAEGTTTINEVFRVAPEAK